MQTANKQVVISCNGIRRLFAAESIEQAKDLAIRSFDLAKHGYTVQDVSMMLANTDIEVDASAWSSLPGLAELVLVFMTHSRHRQDDEGMPPSRLSRASLENLRAQPSRPDIRGWIQGHASHTDAEDQYQNAVYPMESSPLAPRYSAKHLPTPPQSASSISSRTHSPESMNHELSEPHSFGSSYSPAHMPYLTNAINPSRDHDYTQLRQRSSTASASTTKPSAVTPSHAIHSCPPSARRGRFGTLPPLSALDTDISRLGPAQWHSPAPRPALHFAEHLQDHVNLGRASVPAFAVNTQRHSLPSLSTTVLPQLTHKRSSSGSLSRQRSMSEEPEPLHSLRRLRSDPNMHDSVDMWSSFGMTTDRQGGSTSMPPSPSKALAAMWPGGMDTDIDDVAMHSPSAYSSKLSASSIQASSPAAPFKSLPPLPRVLQHSQLDMARSAHSRPDSPVPRVKSLNAMCASRSMTKPLPAVSPLRMADWSASIAPSPASSYTPFSAHRSIGDLKAAYEPRERSPPKREKSPDAISTSYGFEQASSTQRTLKRQKARLSQKYI